MKEKERMLAFGAHPDDVEVGVGGILAKHASVGYETFICDLTKGELSSNGDVLTREKEAAEAARILGVRERIGLHLPDRGLTGERDQMETIIQVIRDIKPDIVLLPYGEDRHPDHVACSKMVKEALFDANILKKNPGLGERHQVKKVYEYFIHHTSFPSLIVDISSHYDHKKRAVLAFESQFLQKANHVSTPINDPLFLRKMESRDLQWGYQIGVEYGEALFSAIPLAVTAL